MISLLIKVIRIQNEAEKFVKSNLGVQVVVSYVCDKTSACEIEKQLVHSTTLVWEDAKNTRRLHLWWHLPSPNKSCESNAYVAPQPLQPSFNPKSMGNVRNSGIYKTGISMGTSATSSSSKLENSTRTRTFFGTRISSSLKFQFELELELDSKHILNSSFTNFGFSGLFLDIF